MYNNTRPATMQGKFTMHRITKKRYLTMVYYGTAILQNPTYRMLRIMVQYTTFNIVVWIKCTAGCEQLMSCNGQGFCEEVGVIPQARDEDAAKMSLLHPIPDPMPAHVNRL